MTIERSPVDAFAALPLHPTEHARSGSPRSPQSTSKQASVRSNLRSAPLFLLVGLTVGCQSKDVKREPFTPTAPEKPLPLGVYISKLDDLLRQWNDAMLRPETPSIRSRRRGLELEIMKRVKQRFPELKAELEASPSIRNREILAAAIGFLREPEALNPLLGALHDPVPEVRAKALLGLSRLVDPNTPVDLVASFLAPDSTDSEKTNAALALYKLGAAGVDLTPVLPEIRLELTNPNPAVRVHCAAAVGEVRDRESIQRLVVMLRDERQLVAAAAANALGKIGDLRTSGALIEALSAPDFAVRDEARGALKRMNDGIDLGSEPGPWTRWREKLDIGGGLETRPWQERESRPRPATSAPAAASVPSQP